MKTQITHAAWEVSVELYQRSVAARSMTFEQFMAKRLEALNAYPSTMVIVEISPR